MRTQARQSRELVAIRTDVPIELDARVVCLPRRQPRADVRAVLASRLSLARHRVCADRRIGRRRTTRSSTRRRPWTPGRATSAPRAPSRMHLVLDAPLVDARRAGRRRASRTSRTRRATCRSRAPRQRQHPAERRAGPVLGLSTRRPPRSRPALPPSRHSRPRSSRCSRIAAVRKIGHDLKAATIVLARHGVALAGIDTDTELVSYVLDATRSESRARGRCARGAQLPGHGRRGAARATASRRGRSPTCRSTR